MPRMSKETAAHVDDAGPVIDRHDDLDGYTVNIVSLREDMDLTPLLVGLPDDQCQCPHWGYVVEGTLTWILGDREEVIGAGDAFYVPPGHTAKAAAGSEFVQFSPTPQHELMMAAMEKNMQVIRSAGAASPAPTGV